jgi:heme/copper-type cytochrome/quinol oxidase subunit 3
MTNKRTFYILNRFVLDEISMFWKLGLLHFTITPSLSGPPDTDNLQTQAQFISLSLSTLDTAILIATATTSKLATYFAIASILEALGYYVRCSVTS